jgi:Lar family restriction alleviation protein
MSEELKPCPFCGGTGELEVGSIGRIRLVVCNNNDCLVEGPIGHSRDEAIAAWNRRAKEEG